jgi:hypothetical protein
MLKLTSLMILGLGLPLLNHFSVPRVLSARPVFAQAQSTISKVPPAATIATAVRQAAIQQWNFPASGRVVRIEPINLRQMGDVQWISATIPTWKITLESPDQRLIYFTNETGAVQMLASRENLQLAAQVPDAVIKATQQAAVSYWYPRYHTSVVPLQPAQVLVKQATPATWNNSCLDLPHPGEACTRNPLKGWQIMVEGFRSQPCPACLPGLPLTLAQLTFRVDQRGQILRADITPAVVKEAFKTAGAWGLAPRSGRIVGAEASRWGAGCENIGNRPIACDPVPISGWLVKIEHQGQRWQVRVDDNGNNGQLMARENIAVDASFDESLANQVRLLAAQHFELTPEQILLIKAEPQMFGGCLGLGNLAETCPIDRGQGYRVTVAGKPGQRQVYRVSARSGVRTEANQGMPPRTDNLPNRIAQTVFQDARSRFPADSADLNIMTVATATECYRTATDDPNLPCQTQIPGGWKITVTNFQKQLVYHVNSAGQITSVTDA